MLNKTYVVWAGRKRITSSKRSFYFAYISFGPTTYASHGTPGSEPHISAVEQYDLKSSVKRREFFGYKPVTTDHVLKHYPELIDVVEQQVLINSLR